MKSVSLILVFFFFLFWKDVPAQQTYPKSFYLIDIKPAYVFDPSTKHVVDSALKVYHKTGNDTVKLHCLQFFSENLEDPQLWTAYNKYMYNYCLPKKDSLHVYCTATALNNMGYEQQYIHNDLKAAKNYYRQADTLYRAINNYGGVGVIINNLAYISQHEGNLQEAIDLYVEAGKMFEKENQPLGLTSIYINLGDIYFQNDELNNAEAFFKKALVYAQKTKQETVIANVYNQLAAVASQKKDTKTAIDYYMKGYAIYEKNKVYSRMALMKTGLANAYYYLKDTQQYIKCVTDAYQASLMSTDVQIKAKVYNKVVSMYIFQKDLKKAAVFADSAYMFSRQINYPELISDAALNLSVVFRKQGNYMKAYDYLQEYLRINDSIHTNAIRNKIIKSQYQLEYNKKEIELKADQEKKDAIRQAEKRQQQLILFIVSVALLAIAVFGFIAFLNYRKTKKANLIIENQKLEVELKNEEITRQKELVDEKQKEIIDSINYAKRIQQAVLTGDDVWRKISKDYFILFKPKDIVSGDFYWAYNTPNNRSVFALADCTGHGVPGGFMSMLGNSFLNEIVVENKIFKANEILNKLRSKIIHALEQKGQAEQKDGMDISLCVWNKIDNTLEFAGANNPLWLVRTLSPFEGGGRRTGDVELIEYKADKMPIGTYLETEVPFSSVTIQLQAGDIIYLTTDGYADQFGGDKGKKFKYKPMVETILRHSGEAMDLQKENLEKAHEAWKAGHEQVDDVCVIGIRVS
jgi:serine phosphatase RsbU (regulator of sigma subunit)